MNRLEQMHRRLEKWRNRRASSTPNESNRTARLKRFLAQFTPLPPPPVSPPSHRPLLVSMITDGATYEMVLEALTRKGLSIHAAQQLLITNGVFFGSDFRLRT